MIGYIAIFIGMTILEQIMINIVYMSNPDLFNDIILTKKNSKKLEKYYKEERK